MAGIDIDASYDAINNINNNNNSNNNNNNNNKIDSTIDIGYNNNNFKSNQTKSTIADVGRYSVISPEDVIAHDIFYCQCTLLLGFLFFFPWFYSGLYMFNTQSGSLKKMGFASICLINLYIFVFLMIYYIYKLYY